MGREKSLPVLHADLIHLLAIKPSNMIFCILGGLVPLLGALNMTILVKRGGIRCRE
jgi:hypothetical protein